MTKQEFKEIREILKLDAQGLAKRLGRSITEILAYESGTKLIPNDVEDYLMGFSPKQP